MRRRLRVESTGAVQGVGFRPFVYRLASDLALDGWVVNDVRAALAEERFEILEVADPRIAAEEWYEEEPDIVVVDLQIRSMGGFAVTRSLRETAGAVLEDPPPTILLLDRAADTFLAGRAGADAWLLKPFTIMYLHYNLFTL